MNHHCRTAILVACVAGMSPVKADTDLKDMFKFRGFLTAAATHCSEKKADFVTNSVLPNGPGYSRNVDFVNDSRIGVQVDAHFNAWLSAAVQVLSERNYDATFTPDVSMAFLKAQAMPWLSFRLGRLPSSAYLISDYKKVGYSTPWVRPPSEIYQGNPFNYITGGEAAVQHGLGPVALTWQLQVGSASAKYGEKPISKFTAKDMYSLSVGGNYGSSTFRVYYLRMKGTSEDPRVDDTIFNPANPILALVEKYRVRNNQMSYLSMGYGYDPGNWFVSGELVRVGGDESIMVDTTSAYLTGGIRIDKWTPYAIIGMLRGGSTSINNDNPMVKAFIEGIREKGKPDQTSQAVGVRYDFAKNMDLKLQFDHVNNKENSFTPLINQQIGEYKAGSYNLITLAYDLVF